MEDKKKGTQRGIEEKERYGDSDREKETFVYTVCKW